VVADPLTSGLKATVEGSELIVLGEVSDGGARARIQVSEYLKGNGPEELVVNGEDNWIEPTGAGCVVRSGDAAAPLPIGKPGLFFLRRDEFGVGDWRPLVRSGVFLLSGERLNGLPGLPSVSEVRAEAERVTGQPSRRSAVAPDPTQPSGDEPARAGDPGDDALSGDSTGDWVVAAAALVLAFLLGAGVVMADLRLRARRRGGG
jgi:hypothetical protein